MRTLEARDLWGPNVEVEVAENGEEFYWARLCLGGKDKEGLYEVILDGPASGEKVYVNNV